MERISQARRWRAMAHEKRVEADLERNDAETVGHGIASSVLSGFARRPPRQSATDPLPRDSQRPQQLRQRARADAVAHAERLGARSRHVIGAEGLVEQLRAKGYRITRK